MYKRLLIASLLLAVAACGKVVPSGSDVDAGPNECSDDTQCGERQTCNIAENSAVCACIAGYAGDPCEWDGALKGSGFDEEDAWQATGAAVVRTDSPGTTDAGEAVFNPVATCEMAKVFQDIVMPTFEDAQPLVLEVQYEVSGNTDFGGGGGSARDAPPPSIGFNDFWYHFPSDEDGLRVRRVCLSDAAFDGPVRVTVAPRHKPRDCAGGSDDVIRVDYVRMLAADPDECSDPGVIINGDMSSAENWTLSSGTDSSAGFIEGIGLDGTRAMEIRANVRCSSASFEGAVSIPGAKRTPSPALLFDWRLNAGGRASLVLDGRTFTTLIGDGVARTEKVCLPPSHHGIVTTLSGVVRGTGSGSCAEAQNNTLMLDNVRVVSEASCGTSAGILDGGFEFAPLRLPFGTTSFSNDGGRADVNSVKNQNLARTGSGVLDLSTEIRCSSAIFHQKVIPPAAQGTSGPALRYFANVGTNPVSTTTISVGEGGDVTSVTLAENNTWTEYTTCLDPAYIGQPIPVQLRINGGSGTCATFGAAEHAFFDDFALTTDASCPTE